MLSVVDEQSVPRERSRDGLDFIRAQARTCIQEGGEQRGGGKADRKDEREEAGLTSWS